MSSSHDEIAEEICNNRRPLKSRVGDLHSAVIQRIDMVKEVYPKLQPVSRVRLTKLKATGDRVLNARAAVSALMARVSEWSLNW